MQNTAFNSRAFHCPAFEPMFPLVGGVESAYAVGLDGSNDYIVTSASVRSPAAGDLTLCGWFYLGSVSTLQVLFSQLDGTGTGQSWLEITAAAKLQSQLGGSATTGSRTLVAGLWHHLAVTVSGTTLTLYVNGISDTTSTRTMQAASGVNNIGASKTPGNYFNGRADDLRAYSRALSAAEVQSIYRNSSSPPTDGLVAYFPMDEGTGTTITDTVGGLVGTLTNGPTWQPQVCPRLKTGRDTDQSWGVSFDGADDYIIVPHNSSLDSSSNISVSMWFKPTNVADTTQILLGRLPASYYQGYQLDWTANSGMNFWIGTGTWGQANYAASNIALNTWHHVCGVYDGAYIRLYINGAPVTTVAKTGNIGTGTAQVYIGDYAAGTGYGFYGNIKDVRIYNSALSASDIAKLANNIPISASPVGHWKLDDGSGTTAIDSSGNGNHGTLTNGPTWTGDIPQWFRPTIESSYAASFDGSDDYISVPNSATLNNLASLSILAFVYLDTLNSPGAMVLSKDAAMYLQLGISGFVTFQHGSGYTQSAVAVISTGKWQHHAGTFDGSNLRYYLNGSASGTPAASTPPTGMDDSMWIGAYSANGGVAPISYWLDGIIDELCIYNVALPAAAIADAAAGYLVRAGLVSRWKLDGNAQDSAGSNHGTEQGGVGYSTSVPGTL